MEQQQAAGTVRTFYVGLLQDVWDEATECDDFQIAVLINWVDNKDKKLRGVSSKMLLPKNCFS